MKTMLMKNISYPVTAAFDEHCSDDDIYKHVAEPLVHDATNEGVSTILMFGKTFSHNNDYTFLRIISIITNPSPTSYFLSLS